ncbi:hypothetical protein RHS04_01966 [Rhizoctonia solani]|uniref:BTB domain-containing protein n=1 Tax=Rhizoctonia solani TaxID=456999 RepID=A0A8H7HEX5_9AGAM|nr:hypothetical protein RHS04_01966 [Rhizoctonia solani]
MAKLHSSLLSRECEMFQNMFSRPARVTSSMSLDGPPEMTKKGKEGSCDENPVIIPQLQPQSFRNFLLIIYGRPGDKEFRSLFKNATELAHAQAIMAFIKIIDIVDLAHRFIAPDIETWALSQLKSYSYLIETINAYPISSESHSRLLGYSKRTEHEELILWARHWTRSYYAGAIETPSIASSAFRPIQIIREQLVQEYKLAEMTRLGHEFWDKQSGLTREDRITLLGAQVRLTPLPQSIPLDWIYLGSPDQPGLRASLELCSECHFTRTWRAVFGSTYQDMLGSIAPLGGVFALSILPSRRQKFANGTKSLASDTCTKNCRDVCLKYIDKNMDAVFHRLTKFLPGPVWWSTTMSARHEDSWAAHLTDLTSSTLSHPTYPQDPTYYFRDGSLLLLVEETLFKVHSSILGRESEAFNILDPIDFCNTNEGIAPVHIAGETAFEIADLKAEHFRHFLFIFYGLPSSQNYRRVMSCENDAPQDDHNSVVNFHIYLDVAEIASRFSAHKLSSWAHDQLRKIAKAVYEELSRFLMRTDYQLRALLYAKRTQDEELVANVRNAIQLHFAWVSTSSPLKLINSAAGLDGSRERLIRVFKHPKLKEIDPALFGFAPPAVPRRSSYAFIRTSSFDASPTFDSRIGLGGNFELPEPQRDGYTD